MSEGEESFKLIKEDIGLFGATILLVGNVIAMTTFLLPAHLAEDGVGPEMALAMVLVAAPVFLRILGTLQVGGAMPAAGGAYVYASRLIHPFFGFLLPWLTIPAVWFGQVYLAWGFAEFIRYFLPGVPMVFLMYGVMIPFIVLNILGIRIVAQAQILFVAIIISGMLMYIIPGTFHVDPANYTPMFVGDGIDDSFGPFIVGVVTLSIALHGFGLATDLGEELRDPVRNIPRVLLMSAAISVTLMVGVVVVAVGVVPVDYYLVDGEALEAGVAVSAEEFLPSWGAALVALAAVVGAFTSLNTLYTSYSRQIMRAARDETLPLALSSIHPRFQTPHRAILLISIPAMLLVPLWQLYDPVVIALTIAMISLFGSILAPIVLWNLPKRFPRRYEYSLYRLPRPFLKAIAIFGFVTSGAYFVLVSTQRPLIAFGILFWFVVAIPAYYYRVRSLREKKGIDLPKRMKKLHHYEEARAEAGSRVGGDED